MKTKSFFALMLGMLLVLGACNRSEVALEGTPLNGHEWVDLGLPSGTLWATCNVGANSPEEYGNYFAWGETQQKSSYSWSTYKYGTGCYELTKYCNNRQYGKNGYADTITVLDPEDDAAMTNWGIDWCMPPLEAIMELEEECTWHWTRIKGVKGRLATGPNGNSIFLPAAGYYEEGCLYKEGSGGKYWSASLYLGNPVNSYYLDFDSESVSYSSRNRGQGIPVRPIVAFSVEAVEAASDNESNTEENVISVAAATSDVMQIIGSWKHYNGDPYGQCLFEVVNFGSNGRGSMRSEYYSGGNRIVGGQYQPSSFSFSYSVSGNNVIIEGSVEFTYSNGTLRDASGNVFKRGSNFQSNTEENVIAVAAATSDVMQNVTVGCANDAPSKGSISGHDYVNLGLPSGTLWATSNVGADSPEEYGDYFAWGETNPKSNYWWSTYKYSTDYNKLTKYCNDSDYGKDGFTDNKTMLDAEDDAATANWGNGWRIPTEAEMKELKKECSWEWTEPKGVCGYRVTGPNGSSLFLPAAGYYEEGYRHYAGDAGDYWSSTLYGYGPYYACFLSFYRSSVYRTYERRCYGRSVRPVVRR